MYWNVDCRLLNRMFDKLIYYSQFCLWFDCHVVFEIIKAFYVISSKPKFHWICLITSLISVKQKSYLRLVEILLKT